MKRNIALIILSAFAALGWWLAYLLAYDSAYYKHLWKDATTPAEVE